jgi:hypothetical protein
MSAALSPRAARALLSVLSSVCCVTLLEVDALESDVDAESDAESDASKVSAEDAAAVFWVVEPVCALAPDPLEPEFVLLPA